MYRTGIEEPYDVFEIWRQTSRMYYIQEYCIYIFLEKTNAFDHVSKLKTKCEMILKFQCSQF